MWRVTFKSYLKLVDLSTNTAFSVRFQEDAILSHGTSESSQGFLGVVVLSVPNRAETAPFYTTFPVEVDACSKGPRLFVS